MGGFSRFDNKVLDLQIAFIHAEDLWISVDSVDINPDGKETGIGMSVYDQDPAMMQRWTSMNS